MVISVEDFRRYANVSQPDLLLAEKLRALELLIRSYSNNNFQCRAVRYRAEIRCGEFLIEGGHRFIPGNTVQVSECGAVDGLYTVKEVTGVGFTVEEPVFSDGKGALVTLVLYPEDVRMGIVNMLKWDLASRDKVGIASETLSRHSVTYFNMDGDNSVMGYPRSLLGFLRPYRRAHT